MASEQRSHWVEGTYRRDDSTTFTARFYVLASETCPEKAVDEKGVTGTLVPETCREVNKGCFIATATLGSEVHPRVQELRAFRDEVLLKSNFADAFVKLLGAYYTCSPPVASVLEKSKGIKFIFKWAIVYPVIAYIEFFVALLKSGHPEWERQNKLHIGSG